MLRALGRAIDELGGRYLAAEDVGATTADMDTLALETPWVTGVSESAGGSGDPSPVTAVGVLARRRSPRCKCSTARRRSPDGASRCRARGTSARTWRVSWSTPARTSSSPTSTRVAPRISPRRCRVSRRSTSRHVLDVECDVLSPCALGGVVTEAVVPRLKCRVVCGAANNQLTGDAVDDELHERGILYVPDFVASAGGIINIAEEFTGYSA